MSRLEEGFLKTYRIGVAMTLSMVLAIPASLGAQVRTVETFAGADLGMTQQIMACSRDLGRQNPSLAAELEKSVEQGNLQRIEQLCGSRLSGGMQAFEQAQRQADQPGERGSGQQDKKSKQEDPKQQMAEEKTTASDEALQQRPGDQQPASKTSVLSTIESLFWSQSAPNVGERPLQRDPLRQFGYKLFDQEAAFSPPATSLVGPDYVLGPDDEFTVTLWGLVDGVYQVKVSPEGTVVFPKVGEVPLAGVRYGDLENHLKRAFSRHFKNFRLTTTMGKLRSIQVFLVGEVQKPGSYRLSSLSTIFNALFASGGPTKDGTLRDVQLIRNGEVVSRFDLYNFLLHGDKSRDTSLRDQDTVFVPVIGDVVAVGGEVKRPAIYELKNGGKVSSLGQVLELAGGVRPTGMLERVQIERVQAHQERRALDIDLSGPGVNGTKSRVKTAATEVPVQNLDFIKVFPIDPVMRNAVYLKGHVTRPGPYQFQAGMRVADLIHSKSELLPDAYLGYAHILRLTNGDGATNRTREIIPINLQKALQGDPEANVKLQSLDELMIYSRENVQAKASVQILGEVQEPGKYPLVKGAKISDLLLWAGGLKEEASFHEAELTRYAAENGRTLVETIAVNMRQALAGQAEQNLALRPFDVLVIRPIPENEIGRSVTLEGEVKHPGVYTITRGERLSSVLRRAGGLTAQAYPRGAVFIRQAVKKAQEEQLKKVRALHEQGLSAQSSALAVGGLEGDQMGAQEKLLMRRKEFPNRLAEQITLGRMVVRVDRPDRLEGTAYDIMLKDGDRLEIPSIPETISVLGSVRNPTALPYEPGIELITYVKRAGGLTPDANWEGAYIMKADGSAESLFGSVAAQFGEVQMTSLGEIEPGDALVIPPRVDVMTQPIPTWNVIPDPSQASVGMHQP